MYPMSYHAHLRRIKRIERASSKVMFDALRDPLCNERSEIWHACEAQEEKLIKLAWQQWNASRQKHSKTYKEGL